MRLLVIDGNAPWVRSFFAAMPPEIGVDLLRVYSAVDFFRQKRGKSGDVFRWRDIDERTREFTVLVPGWTRTYRASTVVVQTAIRMVRSEAGGRVLVFTSPYYAGAASVFPALPKFYLAHDVFRFYDWDAANIVRLEKQLLDACDASFVVAKALAEDFRHITTKPVEYSPMAATAEFVERLAKERGPVPDDLTALKRPIVGCVGQINRSYDWDLIAGLTDATPDVQFVFVGPIFPEPPDVLRRINGVLAKPNVRHLGVKPHDQLPHYLQDFDICFNPLAVNDHNDRRSPLRLFDYLATDRPILSTDIREAHEHVPFIEIGKDVPECAALLRKMLAAEYRTDLTARAEYIRKNTWHARAAQLLHWIDSPRKQ